MKLAHTGDWHLGYRAYDRAVGGVNQRERDVEGAVERCVADIIAWQPDVLAICGDVFHSVRPPNRSILFLFAQLQRVRTESPQTRIVLIPGDHDIPRSADQSPILELYRALDVLYVQWGAYMDTGAGYTLHVVPVTDTLQLKHMPAQGHTPQILITHGDALGLGDLTRFGRIEPDWLQPYAYAALGHYHANRHVAYQAWYAGSLEYTSSDPWSETTTAKGWVAVTLDGDASSVVFHPIATRVFHDLAPLNGAGCSVRELNEFLEHALAPQPDGAVVRARLLNVSRETQHALDHQLIAQQKARLLHLTLQFERPESQAATPDRRAALRKSLDMLVDDFLAGRALPADVDRTALRELGKEYLTSPDRKE